MKKLITLLIIAMLFASLTAYVFAGGEKEATAAPAYPTKAVDVTVIFGPGSAADLIGRKVADLMQAELGQPMPVVNRTGGGQSVGYTHVLNQRPDGYSIVWNSNGLHTAYFQGNIDFTYEAFKGIARISYEPVSLAVNAASPWRTMEEFIAYVKSKPGEVTIGNSGVGTFTHLTGVAVEDHIGVEINHVPFGQGLAVASLLGGQIEASIQLPSEVIAQEEAGLVRILAVTGPDRMEALPHVSTLLEQNIPIEMILWRGLAVHKDTPANIVSILEAATKKVVESPDFIQFAEQMSIIPAYMSSDEFNSFIAQDFDVTGTLMRRIGATDR